jgi:hypothetical protein
MFSKILSLEASFSLAINQLSQGWLIEIIILRVILVITLVVRPLLLIPSLILLRAKVVIDEVHILMGFRTVVP